MKANREQNQNRGSSLQMAPPIFQPRPRHQLRPPSMGLFDDFHPLVNNRMYFPSASSMTIPPPLLNDFPTSFPVGAGPSYGMLPYPPQDLSRHHYLPSMDFGYGFPSAAFFPPARPPPLSLQSAFMPSRQDSRRQHDASMNVQYRAHMAALQSHVDSFIHSFQADGTEKSAPKSSFGDGSSSAADNSNAASYLDFDTFKLKSTPGVPSLPKLHSGGHQPPSSQSSFCSPSSSHFAGMPLPPLHLPVFKAPVLSSPPAQADKSETRRNFRDSKAHGTSSSQHCGVEDASSDEATGVKMPKLPPLLIGNKDLARKLSEEEQGTRRSTNFQSPNGNADSDIRNPEHNNGQHGHVRKTGQGDIAESSDGIISRSLLVPSGKWVEDMVAGVVGRESCGTPPLVSSDMSDIEVMREAYGFRNFHRQQQLSPASSSNIASAVSKHSGAYNLTSTPLPGPATKRRRQSSPVPSGMLPSARPNFQTFPYLVPYRKEAFRQFSDSGPLPGFDSSEQTSHPISVSAVPSVNTVSSSFDQLRTERRKLPSGNDTTDCGDMEVSSGTIHVKQELNDDALDFTVSSNMSQSFDTPETDRDLLSLGSREAENPSEDRSNGHWIPDADVAAEEGNGLDEDGFLMPLVDSLMDLNYGSTKSCHNTGALANGMGDERNGEFRCHLCNYSGRSQHCLNKHFRAHSQAYKICRYCMKAFERPSDLVRHEERHQKRNHVLLKRSSNVPVHRTADYAPNRASKKRKAWFCQQCDFSCHEARKLIVHTRKMHPIHFECKLCRMKFASEAELAEHKTARHPVALGRMDTYWNGVVTATKLVTCEVTNDQEISISFDEILELPFGTDTDGIPEVSNLREAQHILNKNGHDKEDCLVKDYVVLSQEGAVNCMQEPSLAIPSTESISVEEESPTDICRNSLGVDSYADVLDLSSTSFSYSSLKDKMELVSEKTLTEPSAFSNMTEAVEQVQTQSSAADYPEPEDMHTVEDLALPSTSKQTSVSDNDSFEATASDDHVGRNCSPTLPVLTENNCVEIPKNLGRKMPVAVAKKSTNSRYKPAKLAGKVPVKRLPKDRTNFVEKIKIVSKDIKVEVVDNNAATNGLVLPAPVSDAVTGLSGANEIAPSDDIAKSEVSNFPDTANETDDVKHDKTADALDSLNRKCFTFICVRCKYSTNSKFKYQQHLKAHNGRYICKRCNKACIKSSDLYRHWVTHNVKGPNGHFACDSCDFTSPQKYIIENHMKQHYMLNPTQPRHQLSLMSRCGICQKNVLRSRLFEHKRVVHGTFFTKPRSGDGEMDANGNSIKVPPKTFACPQCDRRFTTPSYLLRHHFLHHQEESDSSAQAKAEESNACSCRFCGLKFDDVDLLQEHEISHIVQTCSDVNYVERCRKRKRHHQVLVKTNDVASSTVKCDTPKSLKKRSPRRKLSCPHCGKHFKVQYFLDQHLRVHSDERPFVCQWCGAGFAIFQYLNIHRRFKCPNRGADVPAALDAQKDCCNSETNEQAEHSDQLLT